MQKKNNHLQKFLCIVFSLTILYLLSKQIDFRKTLLIITHVNIADFIISLLCIAFMTIIIAPLRWRLFMRLFGVRMSYLESTFIKMAISPLKIIFPFMSEEFFRGSYFNTKYKLGVKGCTAYVIANISLGIFTLLLLASFGGVAYSEYSYFGTRTF